MAVGKPQGSAGIVAHHVEGGEDVAVMVAGLEVFGDVGECGQVFRVLSRTRDVADLMLCNDVLRRELDLRDTRLILLPKPTASFLGGISKNLFVSYLVMKNSYRI